MTKRQRDLKIPTELIPKCPVCGSPAAVNLRCNDKFVQDEGWYAAAERYGDFIRRHEGLHVLFSELGVGFNTPAIIKYPFWQMNSKNPKAVCACINYGEALCPDEIGRTPLFIRLDNAPHSRCYRLRGAFLLFIKFIGVAGGYNRESVVRYIRCKGYILIGNGGVHKVVMVRS